MTGFKERAQSTLIHMLEILFLLFVAVVISRLTNEALPKDIMAIVFWLVAKYFRTNPQRFDYVND